MKSYLVIVLTKRTQLEIIMQVLEHCLYDGNTQTQLLQGLRLNTDIIKTVLTMLLQNGLLTKSDNPDMKNAEYKISDRGKKALLVYYSLINEYLHKPNSSLDDNKSISK